jgi:hypothetical protein
MSILEKIYARINSISFLKGQLIELRIIATEAEQQAGKENID